MIVTIDSPIDVPGSFGGGMFAEPGRGTGWGFVPASRWSVFGAPIKMYAFPRSVRAPRIRGIPKSWSASLTRWSKPILYSLTGVLRSGSRFAQKSWTNLSASSSDVTFFHSFCSASVARNVNSGEFFQSLYRSRPAERAGNADTATRTAAKRKAVFILMRGIPQRAIPDKDEGASSPGTPRPCPDGRSFKKMNGDDDNRPLDADASIAVGSRFS